MYMYENYSILNAFLDSLLLQLLLRSVQSSVWKLIGQYDYHKLVCQQSINTDNFYTEY